jgi:hypothetical protein
MAALLPKASGTTCSHLAKVTFMLDARPLVNLPKPA